MMGIMAIKNSHKKSSAAVLSCVAAEMAKPRVAESTKRDADTLANGGHRYVNPFLKKHVYRPDEVLGCLRAAKRREPAIQTRAEYQAVFDLR